jgi:aryl-alcohol dehydrogenase-like predicted oxidoreductase
MMKYRRLGRSGLMISEMVLGTMNFGNPTDKAESFKIIGAALDAGINLFDCADVYAEGESEKILGEAFSSNGKRQEVFITSKVFMRTGEGPNDAGNSKHHILAACENSLRRLKTDSPGGHPRCSRPPGQAGQSEAHRLLHSPAVAGG